MKLLMISACLPGLASGASTRNYHLLKALARRHTVSLLSLVDLAEVDMVEELPLVKDLACLVQLIPHEIPHSKRWQQLLTVVYGRSYLLNLFALKKVQAALDLILARDLYDAVIFESVLIAGYQLPPDVKVIIDQHNIEHELLLRTYKYEKAWLRKLYGRQEYSLVRRAELERCRNADLILTTSARERHILQGLLPKNSIEVVPNGVDVEAFNEICTEREAPNQIIFTGTMNYYPNIEGVLFFIQQCWPLIRAQIPAATFQIVGKNPPPEIQRLAALPDVVVTGKVPDIRSYLATSAVAIAPLQIGSGTRLKILEALAMGKATVSTTIGCEGLALVPGEHLLVADQPEAFAQAVVDLLRDPARRRTLGLAGRSFVETEYSWERCGSELLRILENNCKESK